MTDSSKSTLNLALFVEKYMGKNKEELIGHLLRAQVSAVQDIFFERLRQAKSLEFARNFLPPFLKTKAFRAEGTWLLALLLKFCQGSCDLLSSAKSILQFNRFEIVTRNRFMIYILIMDHNIIYII